MSETSNSLALEGKADCGVEPADLTAKLRPNHKLPVLETVSKSYSFLFHHGRELLQLIWPLAVVEFVGLWGYFLHRDIALTEAMTPKQAAYLMVALVAAIPMIARVQRFALDPRATSSWLDFHFGKDDLLIIGALLAQLIPILMTFFLTAIAMVILTDVELGVVTIEVIALAGGAAIVLSMLCARFVLIYPATLACRKISLRQAWLLSREHFVRILLICGFATVPFRLIYRLSDIASHHIWYNVPEPVFLKTAVYLGVVILPTTLSVLALIVVAFVALTITYNCLTSDTAEPTTSLTSN